jgi:hypothetical protein
MRMWSAVILRFQPGVIRPQATLIPCLVVTICPYYQSVGLTATMWDCQMQQGPVYKAVRSVLTKGLQQMPLEPPSLTSLRFKRRSEASSNGEVRRKASIKGMKCRLWKTGWICGLGSAHYVTSDSAKIGRLMFSIY